MYGVRLLVVARVCLSDVGPELRVPQSRFLIVVVLKCSSSQEC